MSATITTAGVTNRPSETARLTMAGHRILALDTDDVAVLADRSAGWVVMPDAAYQAVRTFLGDSVCRLADADAASAEILIRLWDAGLLLADGSPTPAAVLQRPQWPNALLLKLTGGCNIACTYCYDYDSARFQTRLHLDRMTETIDQLVDNVDQLAVVFHGGEPLLQFDLLRKVVEHCQQLRRSGKQIGYSIQTNGTLFTPEIVRYLDAHDFSVGISMDGASTEANALRVVRRGGSVADHLKKLMRDHPSFVRERCGFLAVASRTSAPHLPEFATWLQDFGVSGLTLTFLDLVGRGAGLNHERLAPEEAVALVATFVDMVGDGSIEDLDVKTLTSRINNLFTLVGRDLCHKGPCGASGEFLVLDSTGGYRSCDCIYDPYFELDGDPSGNGTVPTAGHRKRLAIVDRTDKLRTTGTQCSSCALFGLCGGTCVAKAIARSGNPVSVDPVECALSKFFYPLLLNEFAKAGTMPLFDYFNRHRSNVSETWMSA